MTRDAILDLLCARIGIDPTVVGVDAIHRAVSRRMAERGIAAADDYLQHLLPAADEWQLLIDEVVVPETWFFRDGEPFAYLQHYATHAWLPAHGDRPLRVLSVPCASGEEPYSIAMALVEAGLAPDSFEIDAVDVSRKALEKAQLALYGGGSFRGPNLDYRGRHFTPRAGNYQLVPRIARKVSFQLGNLLDPLFTPRARSYDVIFCRNLLIYFHAAARQRAVQALDRLLCDAGLLFTGHAESAYTLGPRFAAHGPARAFAYRKAAVASTPLAVAPCAASVPAAPAAAPAPLAAAEDPRDVLARASRLADEGRLDRAAALCQELIDARRACQECFCLLGLIQEGLGQTRAAEEYYCQALALDPAHHESLVHLTLLVEARGEVDRAAALRDRAQRVASSARRTDGARP